MGGDGLSKAEDAGGPTEVDPFALKWADQCESILRAFLPSCSLAAPYPKYPFVLLIAASLRKKNSHDGCTRQLASSY